MKTILSLLLLTISLNMSAQHIRSCNKESAKNLSEGAYTISKVTHTKRSSFITIDTGQYRVPKDTALYVGKIVTVRMIDRKTKDVALN